MLGKNFLNKNLSYQEIIFKDMTSKILQVTSTVQS